MLIVLYWIDLLYFFFFLKELKNMKYFCPSCIAKGKMKAASVIPISIDKTRFVLLYVYFTDIIRFSLF
jgi:hypothetical protein